VSIALLEMKPDGEIETTAVNITREQAPLYLEAIEKLRQAIENFLASRAKSAQILPFPKA
jgi:hypothetical protein